MFCLEMYWKILNLNFVLLACAHIYFANPGVVGSAWDRPAGTQWDRPPRVLWDWAEPPAAPAARPVLASWKSCFQQLKSPRRWGNGLVGGVASNLEEESMPFVTSQWDAYPELCVLAPTVWEVEQAKEVRGELLSFLGSLMIEQRHIIVRKHWEWILQNMGPLRMWKEREAVKEMSEWVSEWSHLSPSRLFWLPLLQFALGEVLHCLFQQQQPQRERGRKTNTTWRRMTDRMTKLNTDWCVGYDVKGWQRVWVFSVAACESNIDENGTFGRKTLASHQRSCYRK